MGPWGTRLRSCCGTLRDRQTAWITYVVFFAVLANVPFWCAVPLIGLERSSLFGLDYAAAGLLCLFIPSAIGSALLLFFVILADVIFGVSQTFEISPVQCVRNVASLSDLSADRLAVVGLLAGLMVLVAAAAAPLRARLAERSQRRRAAKYLIAFTLLVFLVDLGNLVRVNGRLPRFSVAIPTDSVPLSSFKQIRLTRIPLIGLVRLSLYHSNRLNFSQYIRRSDTTPSPSAVRAALDAAAASGVIAPDVVVVVAESWGAATDPLLRKGIVAPFSAPALLARYEVRQGTVPFFGSTVAGEGRELCGSKIGFHLLSATAAELKSCIPDRLAAEGYDNIAVHGNSGHMFDRLAWYPTIGFREEWFRQQFRQSGLPDCPGAATGTCDAAVASWISQRLARADQKPEFVYWLTLNSHLPVPTPAPLPGAVPCSLTPLIADSPSLCSWYQLVANVQNSVSRLAMSRLARPTVFVVVGDHAPPFGDPVLRNQFSASVVPYIVLIPHPTIPSRMSGPNIKRASSVHVAAPRETMSRADHATRQAGGR